MKINAVITQRAHELARQTVAKHGGDYRATFSAAMRVCIAERKALNAIFDASDSGHEPFTVEFIKRTNGQRRVMNASELMLAGRVDKPGQAQAEAWQKGLMLVVDLDCDALRSIPLENVLNVSRWA